MKFHSQLSLTSKKNGSTPTSFLISFSKTCLKQPQNVNSSSSASILPIREVDINQYNIMAHSLVPATIPISTTRISKPYSVSHQKLLLSCNQNASSNQPLLHTRRIIAVGFGGTSALGLINIIGGGDGNANAAARRPPPPPPTEKKDPNVSGVTAKILASKKRKEAMKESVAKLRERGKPITES